MNEENTVNEQPAAKTVEELRDRCGHECLHGSGCEGPHFYGSRMGPHSYEGLLRRVAELEAGIAAHSGGTRVAARDTTVQFSAAKLVVDRRLWALIDREGGS